METFATRAGGHVSLLPPPPGSDPGTGPIPATSPPPLGAMPFAPPTAGAIPAPGAPDPATGPVPMALPYGPADATTPRWTADSNLAKLTIPYLGPEPRPSDTVRRVFLLACVVDVIIYLAKAWLYLHQAGIERDFLRHPTRFASQELTSGSHTLSTMGTDRAGRDRGRADPRRGVALAAAPEPRRATSWVRPTSSSRRGGSPRSACGSPGVCWPRPASCWARPAPSISRRRCEDYPHRRELQALEQPGLGRVLAERWWSGSSSSSAATPVGWRSPVPTGPTRHRCRSSHRSPAASSTLSGSGSSSAGTRSGSSGIRVDAAHLRPHHALLRRHRCADRRGAPGSSAATPMGYPWFAAGLAMWGFVIWVMIRRYRLGKL